MTDNLCAVLYGKHDVRMEYRPIPEPGPGEVQVAVARVGLCGSDMAWWQHGRIADYTLVAPTIKGHEAAGVVTAVGEGVADVISVGDRVCLEPGVPCHTCERCKKGRYNLCGDMRFLNCPPHHGFLTNFTVMPATYCHRLPDHVSLEEGALMEPLAVAVHACQRAGVCLGSTVLVCGAGPVGLLTMMTARAFGAASVCITDISESRLALAKGMGADYTIKVNKKPTRDAAPIIQKTMGGAADIAIECSGAEASIQTAIHATRTGGVLAIVGLGVNHVNIPIVDAACREIDIRGVFRYKNNFPAAIELVSSGKVDVKPLITHRFPLDESINAFLTAESRKDGVVKVMVNCT